MTFDDPEIEDDENFVGMHLYYAMLASFIASLDNLITSLNDYYDGRTSSSATDLARPHPVQD